LNSRAKYYLMSAHTYLAQMINFNKLLTQYKLADYHSARYLCTICEFCGDKNTKSVYYRVHGFISTRRIDSCLKCYITEMYPIGQTINDYTIVEIGRPGKSSKCLLCNESVKYVRSWYMNSKYAGNVYICASHVKNYGVPHKF
jgi:hypothetical protein